jgi:hypothetical protein
MRIRISVWGGSRRKGGRGERVNFNADLLIVAKLNIM